MLLRVNVSLLAVFFLILLMPLSIARAATHVEVAVDQLNIRSEPGTTTQIVATLKKATRLPITKQQKDWTQVKLPNGNTGWVNNRYVKMIEVPQIKYVRSNVDMLNVRAEPNATAQILQIIDKNGVFLQMKKQGEWAQIKLSDQKNGWVKASFLTETTAPAPKPVSVPAPAPVPVPTPAPAPMPAPTTMPAPPPPVLPSNTGSGFGQGTNVLTEGYEVYAQPEILGTFIGQIHGGMTINHYGYANGW
ncbi:SH3 domain-containing protein, partial [Brevibacillus sp. NRRL NRS-603]|uniref:SH3 domain-containing protein n=1 Tax=Brevibacillus sp. NRRL NRS-603 TaxID=2126351 RepID=UPI000D2DBCA4